MQLIDAPVGSVPILVPRRATEQRMSALARANMIRMNQAQLKRDLKSGAVCPVEVMLAPPWFAESMKVDAFLRAAPAVGPTKARRILGRAQVAPSRSLGAMTFRQRSAVARLLPPRFAASSGSMAA